MLAHSWDKPPRKVVEGFNNKTSEREREKYARDRKILALKKFSAKITHDAINLENRNNTFPSRGGIDSTTLLNPPPGDRTALPIPLQDEEKLKRKKEEGERETERKKKRKV